jgi:hypothetical protein
MLLAGCYGHNRPLEAAAKAKPRPALIRPMTGRYAITRALQDFGEERFTITSSNARWTVTGRIDLTWPTEQAQGYTLSIDERTFEPAAFTIWIEILGERQEIEGVRAKDYFNVKAKTIAGGYERQVPYAQGTVIDFGSPLFNTLALSLLGPVLEPGRPIGVRTILISLPRLDSTVLLEMYELKGMQDGLQKIAVHPLGAIRPTAMWVRPDGLPVRVRTWVDEGDPFEMLLDPPPDLSTRDSSPNATVRSSTTAPADR